MYPEVVEGLWGVAKVIVAVGEEGVVRQRRDKVNMLLHTARGRQVMEYIGERISLNTVLQMNYLQSSSEFWHNPSCVACSCAIMYMDIRWTFAGVADSWSIHTYEAISHLD